MRSYYAHLETLISKNRDTAQSKPIFRSSAIFPVIHLPSIRSRVLFMGYWMLKRNLKEIGMLVTLRSLQGDLLHRHYQLIDQIKAYRIEVSDLLDKIQFNKTQAFKGSLEVEFFSSVPMVFPFPALVINYYGDQFSSVVHTAQRVYNDFDDMKNNSQTQVSEGGFNLYAEDELEPFITLINGPELVKNSTINLEVINHKNEKKQAEIKTDLNPYQTLFIHPLEQMPDLKNFLDAKPGTARVSFQTSWIFPRLVVGNRDRHLPAMTLTHTYYDCSAAKKESDYWLPTQKNWYPASLMVPMDVSDEAFTHLYFYPIYSPASFCIDVEIYSSTGERLGKLDRVIQVDSNKAEWATINLNTICQQLQIPSQKAVAARIIARNEVGQRIPARVKMALDIGHKKLDKMPCNICVNLQPFNPDLEQKPFSLRWAPILSDQQNASLWVMNSSPAIKYEKTADVFLTFYRERDTETLARKLTLAPHGSYVISPDQDGELAEFLEGKIGWCTVQTTNPYTSAYYFSKNRSGVVGGDHAF